jgi:hypothetical protein
VRFAPFATLALAAAGLAGAWACAPRARMCTTGADCGPARACVSGRCQTEAVDGGAPAIQFARRLVLSPVDVAYVRAGDAAGAGLPAIFTLGRERDGGAVLLLRFSAPVTAGAQVVEAYVLLERAPTVDADAVPVGLHAARVVEPWDSRSVTWPTLPLLEETRAPSTWVRAEGPSVVRLDVRDLVRRWSARDPRDRGLAIVSESTTPTGVAFTMARGAERDVAPPTTSFGTIAPGAGERASSADVAPSIAGQGSLPRLELYLK